MPKTPVIYLINKLKCGGLFSSWGFFMSVLLKKSLTKHSLILSLRENNGHLGKIGLLLGCMVMSCLELQRTLELCLLERRVLDNKVNLYITRELKSTELSLDCFSKQEISLKETDREVNLYMAIVSLMNILKLNQKNTL